MSVPSLCPFTCMNPAAVILKVRHAETQPLHCTSRVIRFPLLVGFGDIAQVYYEAGPVSSFVSPLYTGKEISCQKESVLLNRLQRFTKGSLVLRNWRLRPLPPQASRKALHICCGFVHRNSTDAHSVSGCILAMPYPVANQAIA